MEKLLAVTPMIPTLLLTLGRLSLRAQLWGQARGYLEACIGRNGSPQTYHEDSASCSNACEPDKAIGST